MKAAKLSTVQKNVLKSLQDGQLHRLDRHDRAVVALLEYDLITPVGKQYRISYAGQQWLEEKVGL